MANLATVVSFGVALMPYLVDYAWAQQNVVGECAEREGGCLRCRGQYCARCAVLLHRGTCVDACPSGHTADWSTRDEYMGRICKETGYAFGLTGSQVAVLVGVVSGATVCIFVIICGAIVVHRRKKKAASVVRRFEDSAERREFIKHLGTLRCEARTFLAMLNDTRRQVRELYYSGNNGDGAVGIRAYRPVLRDLSRILVLVNKKDEEIFLPPEDWQRLFAWAERLLGRYKKHTSPEVAQLVTFLQQPTPAPRSVKQQQQPPPPPPPPPPRSPRPDATDQASQPFEMRSAPTNLTTFRANAPLTTFRTSDESSTSPASSSLGCYTKDDGSPIGSSLGQNGSSIYNEKLSPSGSTVGQTTPLVCASQKLRDDNNHHHHHHHHHHHRHHHRHHEHRHEPVSSHLQQLAISAFNHNYNSGGIADSNAASNVLDSELNPQWEFQSSIDGASYAILTDWTPGGDCLVDDFTILGFRPQDEITTEL